MVFGVLFRRQLQPITLFDQGSDLAVIADQALALHFGRVRGEDRDDDGAGEKVGDGIGGDLAVGKPVEGMDETALARRRVGQIMGAAAPDMVLVLGDVGQLQEVAERTDDSLRRIARQWVEQCSEFGAGSRVALPRKAHSRLAHTLDDVEDCFAFLFAHGVAEDAAEKTDIRPQGFVFVAVGRIQRHG